jgi:succinate dehydrogenase/fumarate reductase flavoprotein subunit
MIRQLADIPENSTYDLIVAGAGGAGLAAALFAAIEGKKVLIIERMDVLGGTTALSAATAWLPNSRHASASADGLEDSPAKVARFLDGVVGNRSSASLRRAFIDSAPVAVNVLETNTDVKFRPYATHPDYQQEADGATMRGRAVEPVPFDGRLLGATLDNVRRPIPEFTLFGGMMVDRTDIGHLLKLKTSWASFKHAAGVLGHFASDRIYGRTRGTRLVMGNALIGRLLHSLEKRGVEIVLETSISDFATDQGGITGVSLASKGISRRIKVSLGVVSAAGGFNRHPTRRAELLHRPTPTFSPSAPGHTGEIQDLAIKLGARFGDGGLDHAFWAPVSNRKRPDGTTAVFPHFVMDRSKPGTVCVNQLGRRFVNESTSYHLFARAMFEAHKTEPTIPCFIIADAVCLKKYGLGMVRMGTKNLKPFIDDGYLVEGRTIADLATKLQINADTLESTIANMNRYAETGDDPEFKRGETAYHRINGDPTHTGANPNLGPIKSAPFYAVRLVPGDIGASTGLVTDDWAQVLGADNAPVGRLYACGNEMQSIMGGTYPGPGITIGPGLAFAYRAIQHAVGKATAATKAT